MKPAIPEEYNSQSVHMLLDWCTLGLRRFYGKPQPLGGLPKRRDASSRQFKTANKHESRMVDLIRITAWLHCRTKAWAYGIVAVVLPTLSQPARTDHGERLVRAPRERVHGRSLDGRKRRDKTTAEVAG